MRSIAHMLASLILFGGLTVASAGTDPVVSINVESAQATEGDIFAPARFSVMRTGSVAGGLLVLFEVIGTSTAAGGDWSSEQLLPLSTNLRRFTFPEGASAVDIDLVATADNMVEGQETLTLRLANGSYTIDPDSVDPFDITFVDDPPAVTLDLNPGAITEGGVSGSMAISRSGGDLSTPLDVLCVFDRGTAEPDFDFLIEQVTSGPRSVISIAADETDVMRSITPLSDNLVEGVEQIRFAIVPATSDTDSYIITSATDLLSLGDNPPHVAIAARDSNAAESGNPAAFRMTRSGGATDSILPVYVELSGTANAPGQPSPDFLMELSIDVNGFVVPMPAGVTILDILVEPIADLDDHEDDETVVLSIRSDFGEYLVDANQQTAVVIIQNVPQWIFSDSFEPAMADGWAKYCAGSKSYRAQPWRYYPSGDRMADLLTGEWMPHCQFQ